MTTPIEEVRRLGKAYGLLAAAFVLFVLVIAMLGQFGLPDTVTAVLVVMVTVVTYAIMGVVARTLSISGFFLSDRAVPAGFNGLATAAAVLALPFAGLAGAYFADRMLGLAATAGLLAGFVLLAVVVAPYYRKSGGITLPDYLAVRFGNPLIRVVAVAILVVVSLPVLGAAMWVGSDVAASVLHLPRHAATIAVLVLVLITALFGGMRATTFVGGAQAVVALLALLVPAVLLSIQEYGFPVPQITFGYADAATASVTEAVGVLAGKALPVAGLDGFNVLAFAVCLAFGVASFPHLVARAGAAPNIGEARRSAGWALVFVAIAATTAPALAAFARLAILRDVVGVDLADLPDWLFDYGRAGLIEVCGAAPISAAAIGTACGAGTVVKGLIPTDIALSADLVTLGFADITGLPYVLTALIAAGAIAAALATAAATVTAIAASLGNDLISRLFARRGSAGRRLVVVRVALIAVTLAAAWIVEHHADEAFAFAVAAPSVAAAGFFPVLVLGMFWGRTTFWGALLGMSTGATVTAVYAAMVVWGDLAPVPIAGLTEAGLSAAAAGIVGVPLGFVVTILVSLLTAAPGIGRREVLDAIRRPSPDPVLEDHAT
ncbi:MAG: VC_2705 family sodium/solute symporter [Bauldia sp.]|nr:VC_2705 family sodium/solute symporter [Bauldia sp.]